MESLERQVLQERQELLGKPLKRAEDPKYLTGSARYVEDIQLKGGLWIAFVRSPYPHAEIKSIDVAEAERSRGVVRIFTAKHILGKVNQMPTVKGDKRAKPTNRPVIAHDRVRYEGEIVAAVVAEDRYLAEDAAELVRVEYNPLPAVVDPEAALQHDAPQVHQDVPGNIAYTYSFESPDFQQKFSSADRVVRVKMLNQRVAPSPMEGRGSAAFYDPGLDLLTIYITTQDPFESRRALAEVLNRVTPSIRVITPDVGGAFGSKISLYPEDVIVAFSAIEIGRPVRWVESRKENLLATTHGRGQVQYAEAAVTNEGRIIALKLKVISDTGAYVTDGSIYTPRITLQMAPGSYDIQAMKAELICALTNKVPQDAYRGAGRPEATYLIERLVNRISMELKIDPVKVRLLNFIPAEKFPYKNASGRLVYDSGDYEDNLMKALQVADYERLVKEKEEARREGRLIGIGIASYVEVCAFSPDYPQTASITVTPEGKVIITSGTAPHGQGHHTPFTQIVSDVLGVDPSEVYFNYGDTSLLPYGTITAGSRSAAVGGGAVYKSALKIKEKMGKIAAKMLEMENRMPVFSDGWIYDPNERAKRVSFKDVAQVAYDPSQLPEGMEPTLCEYSAYAPYSNAFPFGTHIAVVEVDKETGQVTLLKYFAIDDVGRVLNPLIAEGQVHGGVVQGVGQALMEGVFYSDSGSCLTWNFSEYLLPGAGNLPWITWDRTETYTNANLLGVKGIGETGTIAATPAVVNAVEDAVSSYNVKIEKMPLTSSYLWQLLHSQKGL